MKNKIAIYTAAVILGVPTLVAGGSFTTSLIAGKTPGEAVQIVAEQVDSLTGRVDNLENRVNELDAKAAGANIPNPIETVTGIKIDSKTSEEWDAYLSTLSKEKACQIVELSTPDIKQRDERRNAAIKQLEENNGKWPEITKWDSAEKRCWE
jgi:outer membrane murein-binding lipoprotein Lpp